MMVKLGIESLSLGTSILLALALVLVLVLPGLGCNSPQQQQPSEELSEEGTAPASQGSQAQATQAPAEPSEPVKPVEPVEPARETRTEPEPAPQIEEVEIPSGTILELELLTSVDSSLNRAGDELQAKTLSPLFVEGKEVLAAGAFLEGRVTEAKGSGRVKGRARLGFTFDRLKTPTGTVKVHTSYVEREAESGKKKDAAVIGGSAGVGAIVGGVIGGKKGAAIGATVGGAGGTGVVLSTKGEEIRLPAGSRLNVRLNEPVVIQLH